MITKQFRLIFILAVALILAGILAFSILPAGNATAAANSLVGTWKVSVTQHQSLPPFSAVVVFASDGTLTEIEDSGAVGLGVWEKLSGDRYAFTNRVYVQQGGGNFQAKVMSTIQLNGKNHYSGPFYYQFMDLQGNVLAEGYGTATGERMDVEPMPRVK